MTDSSLFLLYQAVAAVAEADEVVVDTVEVAVADTVDPVLTLTVVVAVVVSCAE
jgi:hypothetical protein